MRLLALSDINWLRYNRLVEVVKNERPDVISLAGDSWDDPLSRSKSRLPDFIRFIERTRTTTFIVKGNWDQDEYDRFFHDRQCEYVHEISGKCLQYRGFIFLGIPFSFFKGVRDLRKISSIFPQRHVDFVLTHPPTLRRIWLFDLEPKHILAGHDDNRVCSVNDTLMICTNGSPDTYAIVEANPAGSTITYRDGNDGRIYKAKWRSGKLNWVTDEHFCDRPPHVYPAKDSEYGKLLELLIQKKRSGVTADSNKKIVAPATLLKEYLGTGMGNFA